MDNLHIHSGIVQQVKCMGNVYIHGGVVETMEVQGDCHQNGGVINRCIQQPEPKVVYRDSVVYRNIQATEIFDLRRENDRLRQAIKERDEQQPSDDILISKIRRLENQLTNEREEHRKKVEELEWLLKAVTDIANGRNERLYEDETNGHYIGVTDNSLDVLFTLINEYPIHNDVDMAEELGMSVSTVRYIAKVLRLAKSPEARREAKERLRQHGIEMIERRGGDQTKDKRKKSSKTPKKQK